MEGFDELVQAQQGLILWDQGLELMGKRGMRRRVRDGDLIREHRGLYRSAGVPITDRVVLFGATLLYDGVGSIGAAAYFHGFNRFEVFRPAITVASEVGSRSLVIFGRKIRVYRTNLLPAEHRTVVAGIPMTSPARTICDLSKQFDAEFVGKVLDDAKRRDLLSYEDVAACRRDLQAQGRRRTTVLDEVLDARGLGFHPGESEPELKLRTWLEDAGLHPEVQFAVKVAGKQRRLDLAFPLDLVAVEYQGLDTHGNPTAVVEDSRRVTELQLAGWLVVLITKADGRRKAVQMVQEALEAQRRRLPL